ncbi:single-stranded-DNA-specific exonuclease RecJ [Facklamia miroungae]|uniref:Single-stranded-DNA-specific exonuclease RecJ n=1 Tax=Facklamia miroungae TaxID=120956 RepID=A0A1G7R234_9LACT|nr:single-stranded-DNA-specific exonuclease RecJ [Facklamia miroungae]NKZ29155.1 single-stranded-DNA-specific exonuclease RecJ [Facklamia miroungae]SDG04836.1 single-stranded-DNA-specific exonuclease [Facklamia miroungae]
MLSKYHWHFSKKISESQAYETLKEAGEDYSPAFLSICFNRGLHSIEAIKKATDQEPTLYHDPFKLYQMDKAVERIHRAIEKEEKILIYGDYDADGITSTLILKEALDTLGADSQVYLPNRFTDGYGPNVDRYQTFIDQGIQLIVTVDNGVAGHEAIQVAQDKGVDVIVTDHHELQATLPVAYAIIHPRHPKGDYPFGDLSGAGVAFKVATAILDEIPVEMLDLVAIGTVADMVSLLDENRTLVIGGIKQLKVTDRPGLQLLFKENLQSIDDLSAETIGFLIGPRLNAVGRLGDPRPGFDWLAALTKEEASNLLDFIESENRQRQELVSQIFEEVSDRINSSQDIPSIICQASTTWHPGVLGIVASRICDLYQRPCLLFFYDEEKHQYRGSARSKETFNLFENLSQIKQYLLHFGGHSQAAGMTIEEDSWEDFQKQLQLLAEKEQDSIKTKPSLNIDASLAVSDISLQLIEEIQSLGPFGMHNPKPVILFEDLTMTDKRLIGTNKQHVKLQFEANASKDSLAAIAFSMADNLQDCQVGNRLNVVGELSINEWKKQKECQLIVKDIAVDGVWWIDYRGKSQLEKLQKLSQVVYCFQDEKHAKSFSNGLDSNHQIMLYEEIDQKLEYEDLVLMEPPKNLDQLRTLLKVQTWQKIYLVSIVVESRYLAGLPQREEFAKLYRFLLEKKQIQLKDFQDISNYLVIPLIKIKTMIVVFFEAGFVTIKDGLVIMNMIEQANKHDLMQLPAMQKYQQAMEAERVLNFQTIDQVKSWINEEI